MIEIIPAIDIIDGKCVRLTKGDYEQKKIYDASPVEMAKRYEDCGVKRIHLVDLDGAKASKPVNLRTLEKIADSISIEMEWGGGIADSESLNSTFSAGATKAIVGSVAALKPELFEEWLQKYGNKMILGADVKDGLIAVKGWLETAGLKIEDLVERFLPLGLDEVICTDISKDGMLKGPSFELYTKLQEAYPELSFTVSGGISSMKDIEKLNELGLKKVIVGKAIYENHITLEEVESWLQSE